jgi:hypothetical protein
MKWMYGSSSWLRAPFDKGPVWTAVPVLVPPVRDSGVAVIVTHVIAVVDVHCSCNVQVIVTLMKPYNRHKCARFWGARARLGHSPDTPGAAQSSRDVIQTSAYDHTE